MAFGLFVGCSKSSIPKASFSQKEFVVSRGEEIDIDSFLKVENLDFYKLEISDKELLVKNEKGLFVASSSKSGRTTIKVMHGNNLLTSARVVVKHIYLAPEILEINDEGVISWSKSSVYDEKLVVAPAYMLKIGEQEYAVEGNTFSLQANGFEKGRYNVSVKALATDYVDASAYSKEYSVTYGACQELEISFFSTSQEFGSQEATIAWGKVDNAKYNAYLNGVKVVSGITVNHATFDFSYYNAWQDAKLVLEAVDERTGETLGTKLTILHKKGAPKLNYEGGKLSWQAVEGASKYLLDYHDMYDLGNLGTLETSELSTAFPRLKQGVYDIEIQALGGESEGEYYLNSSTSRSNYSSVHHFAKLGVPELDYLVSGAELKINISENDYVQNYILSADKDYPLGAGTTTNFDLSGYDAGKHEFGIVALPSVSPEGKVIKFEDGHGYSSENVIISDAGLVTAYVLEHIEGIKHEIKNGESVISFKKDANATDYTVSVNNEKVSITREEMSGDNGESIVRLKLGDISKYAPINDKYEIVVEAYRADGYSVNASSEKELHILGQVSAEDESEQNNGFFAWKAVDGDVEYYYEIYSVGKDFSEGDELNSLVRSATTSRLSTAFDQEEKTEALPLGYYAIRVFSRAKAENENEKYNTYLDSDFYDESGYFQAKFYVYEQIETPQILSLDYEEAISKYVLIIGKVENAGRYTIYVNGEREGAITPNNPALLQYTYAFQNTFDEGKFKVEVVADVYNGDATLYPQSQGALAFVERLLQPQFSLDEDEVLSITHNENAKGVIAYLGSSEIEMIASSNVSKLDLSDETQFNGAFNLTFKFVAKPQTDNYFYLDSHEKTYNFKRLAKPSALAYSNGKLLFTSADYAAVSKYIVSVTLVTPNGDYVYKEDTDNLSWKQNEGQVEVSISDYIIKMLSSSQEFSDNYAQSTNILISVSAYKLGELEGVTYLPSRDCPSISLTALAAPKITFDARTQTLSWNAVGTGVTYYTVQVDGKSETRTTALSYDMSKTDFSISKEILVFAENDAFLTSSSSNLITARMLASPSQVQVTQEGIITLTISKDDLALIEKVYCNGEALSSYSNGQSEITLKLSDYELNGETNITLQYKAKQEETVKVDGKEVTNYFIDSRECSYLFENISTKEITIENLENGKLIWNNLFEDFTVSESVKYSLIVKDGEREIDRISEISDNYYSVDDLKAFLAQRGQTLKGKTLALETSISRYNLNARAEGVAKGYYGSPSGERLEGVSSVQLDFIEDVRISNKVERKVKAKIQLSFTDKWNEGASFNLFINDTILKNIKNGDNGERYSLTIEEGVCQLVLEESLFLAGDNQIFLTVFDSEGKSSYTFATNVYRYSRVSNLEISDDGILTITPKADDSDKSPRYYISLNVGGVTQYFESESATVNLLEKFNFEEQILSGNYKVEVVIFDPNKNYLNGVKAIEHNGYRLSGLNAKTTDTGNVEISALNEVELDGEVRFVAELIGTDGERGEVKAFRPTRVESTGVYNFTMREFMNLFGVTNDGEVNLVIAVRKTGSINSAWSDKIKFKYISQDSNIEIVRGRNYNEDYVKILDAENISSTSFRLDCVYTNSEGQSVNLSEVLPALLIKGYWIITGENSGYFSRIPSTTAPSEACYAVKINDFLASVNAGDYTFTVSRIAKDKASGLHVQYKGKDLAVTKLATVTGSQGTSGVVLRNDIVSWNAVTDGKVEGYYVYFYSESEGEFELEKFEFTSRAYLEVQNLLTEGKQYRIEVVSVSSKAGNLASNPTPQISAYKFIAPQTLEVVDGKIRFKLEDVAQSDIAQAIISNRGNDLGMWQAIANTRFKDIFTFNAESATSMYVQLLFRDTNGVERRVSVRAIDLLPDLSLIRFTPTGASAETDCLTALKEALASGNGNRQEWIIANAFYNQLLRSAHGVAGNEILFDKFTESSPVPSGKYTISIRQLGDGYSGTVTSATKEAGTLYVTEAPMITLGREKEDSSSARGKNKYTLTFDLVNSYANIDAELTQVNNYVLHMVNTDGSIGYYFDIDFNGLRAEIVHYFFKDSKKGVESVREVNLVSPFELEVLEQEGKIKIKIDISSLSKRDDISLTLTNYQTSVYAKGNSYSVNSKTMTVSTNFLSLDASSLRIENGVLTWKKPASGEYKNIVKYYYGRQEHQTEDITFGNDNLARLDLEGAGEYMYVDILVEGGYDSLVLAVDSPVYRINNLYKLSQPFVNASGNTLNISKVSSQEKTSDDYMISNDNAGAGFILLNSSLDNFSYKPGLQGLKEDSADYSYKQTESTASKFFITSVGTKAGGIVLDKVTDNNFDFEVKLEDDKAFLLSSSAYEINARMLSVVQNVVLKEGDIYWEANDDNYFNDNAELVYKVDVEWRLTDTHAQSYSVEKIETFYTTKTTFDTSRIESLYKESSDTKFENYVFTIQKYAFKRSSDGEIETLEGLRFSTSAVRYDDNSFVLASDIVTYGNGANAIKKAPIPTEVRIVNGTMQWNEPVSFVAGIKYKVVDTESHEVYQTSNASRSFKGENLSFDRPYNLGVYSFYEKNSGASTGLIKSDIEPLRIDSGGSYIYNTYKLPQINDFVLGNNSENLYSIDLSQFMQNNLILGTDTYYKIEMDVKVRKTESSVEEIVRCEIGGAYDTLGQNKKVFYIEKEGQELRAVRSDYVIVPEEAYSYEIVFQLQNAQGTRNVLLLAGNTTSFNITPITIQNEDIEVKWEEENKQFSWSSLDQALLYKVAIHYADYSIETAELSATYYKPNKLGTIVSVDVFVRQDRKCLYSLPVSLEKEVDNRLFASGQGTEESPYMIGTVEQFLNIQFKNEKGVFFKQLQDLTISDKSLQGLLVDGFKGNYDGNEMKIYFAPTAESLKEEALTISPLGASSMSFARTTSLFGNIASGGIVHDLKLRLSYIQATLSQNTVFSGIAITNNGTIYKVEIENIDLEFNIRASYAVAPVAVSNCGTIRDCKNNADVSASTSVSVESSVLYAGFVLTNARGTIVRCENSGSITAPLRRSTASAYIAGIALYNNSGTIKECGNEGNISASGSGGNGYLAGICLRSARSATIAYCYNNALISSVNTSLVGGIAYNVTDTTTTGLISTPERLKICSSSSGGSHSQNYCMTEGGLPTSSLEGVNIIDCEDGYVIIIQSSEGGYKAQLSKS